MKAFRDGASVLRTGLRGGHRNPVIAQKYPWSVPVGEKHQEEHRVAAVDQ